MILTLSKHGKVFNLSVLLDFDDASALKCACVYL
ncbi:hypothetical protein BDCR2A_01329 [Borrelia duttonii CR2A]|uniref:Uncharacterized protein n=2 Tax=Borrelia TaxID=138 RepID=W6TH39_9SPIR|nr:hypothetical protein BCD_1873 [Borrelia crocidurae DOU]ETZ17738.1 hypothetical protein BDCR2A_01329 [Borrelia duttonii CR2A]